jgi:hypothetical protein
MSKEPLSKEKSPKIKIKCKKHQNRLISWALFPPELLVLLSCPSGLALILRFLLFGLLALSVFSSLRLPGVHRGFSPMSGFKGRNSLGKL